MRRFMVHPVTEVEFEDGDEASDAAAQNCQKHLKETVRNAAQGLLLHTIKDATSKASRSQNSRLSSSNAEQSRPAHVAPICARTASVASLRNAKTATTPPTSMSTPCRRPSSCRTSPGACAAARASKAINTRPAWHTGAPSQGFRPRPTTHEV
jgi:hypothetical protein